MLFATSLSTGVGSGIKLLTGFERENFTEFTRKSMVVSGSRKREPGSI